MSLNSIDGNIREHYKRQGLEETILAALTANGKDINQLKLDDLAPVDEFHIRGREATRELASKVKLNSNHKVLDVGSGIGGASRFLASEFGCQVVGLDLSEDYCRVAQSFANRLGLANSVRFIVGSALDMPFEDNSFDIVWTQHATMNIANKAKLYSEIARVLRPNGYFAMYDILAGPVSPLCYPVPWATDPSISFLLTPNELRELLEAIGFKIISWQDTSEIGQLWFKGVARKMNQQDETPTLGFQILMGSDFKVMAKNQVLNLNENRIALIECVAQKFSNTR